MKVVVAILKSALIRYLFAALVSGGLVWYFKEMVIDIAAQRGIETQQKQVEGTNKFLEEVQRQQYTHDQKITAAKEVQRSHGQPDAPADTGVVLGLKRLLGD